MAPSSIARGSRERHSGLAALDLAARCGVAPALAGLLVAGCAGMIPDSATQENQTLLYGEFYKAGFAGKNGVHADDLARRLEICGRQLYIKDEGFFGAMRKQEKHGGDVSFGEVIALFTEDACLPPDGAGAKGQPEIVDAVSKS